MEGFLEDIDEDLLPDVKIKDHLEFVKNTGELLKVCYLGLGKEIIKILNKLFSLTKPGAIIKKGDFGNYKRMISGKDMVTRSLPSVQQDNEDFQKCIDVDQIEEEADEPNKKIERPLTLTLYD